MPPRGEDPMVCKTTYKAYKEDTASIAGWLAANAVKVGYKILSPIPQGGTRLKGKARKEAKAKGGKASPYTIRISDFSAMARVIAEARPKIDVPEALDNIFSRVLAARTAFAMWFEEHSHGDEGNNRHSHFINVLTSTWSILRPNPEARTSHVTPKASKPEQEPSLNFANRFSGLNVEETPEECLNFGTSAGQAEDYKLPGVAPVVIQNSEEDLEDDFMFAIYTFMCEVEEVRFKVQSLWEGYRRGILELMLCSIVTNTAIQLVRRAEHELDLTIERPKKYPASTFSTSTFLPIFMHTTHEEDVKTDLDAFLRPGPMTWDFACCHAALCLWPVFTSLQFALHQASTRGANVLVPSAGEIETDLVASGGSGERSSGDRSENDSEDQGDGCPHNLTFERVEEISTRIKNMLPCFQAISYGMAGAFASDEITSGLETMFKTQTISIWVAFGLQLLLDIQDGLRDNPEKPLKELQKHARWQLDIHKGRQFDQEPYVVRGELSDDRGFQQLTKILKDYEGDIFEDYFRRKLFAGMVKHPKTGQIVDIDDVGDSGAPEFIKQRDYFLRINPVKCGMLKYGVYLHPHQNAIKFEEAWRGITGTLHLYIACRSLFPDQPVWPDMEFLIHNQADLDSLFFGGLPKTMEEAHKKFMLASGVTASNFARNRRNIQPNINMDKARSVSNPCLLDSLFTKWMCGGSLTNDDTIIDLVRLIGEQKYIDSKARQTADGQDFAPEVVEDRTISDTLNCMMYSFIAETQDLYFDWLSFAETCQTIFKDIFNNIESDDDGEIQKTRSIFVAVYRILNNARQCQWFAEEIAKAADVNGYVRENAKDLIMAWRAIQDHVRTEMSIPSGNGWPENFKSWAGDRQILKVISLGYGQAGYPHISRSLFDKVYRNWTREETDESVMKRILFTRFSGPTPPSDPPSDSPSAPSSTPSSSPSTS